MTAQREFDVSRVERDDEDQRIKNRIRTIDAENIGDNARIEELDEAAMQAPDDECDDYLTSIRYFQSQIEMKNQERAGLIKLRDNLHTHCTAAEDKAFRVQGPVIEALVSIFEDLGMLPQFEDINAAPLVQVIEETPPDDIVVDKAASQAGAESKLVTTLTKRS
jgi:hypothetical protein